MRRTRARGLIITGFEIGCPFPGLDISGNPGRRRLIQGNFIGDYVVYPVDRQRAPPRRGNSGILAGEHATRRCRVLDQHDGRRQPAREQRHHRQWAAGDLAPPGASGNQVLGNQIGVVGPLDNGLYATDGNGAEGVWIQSSGGL